MALDADCDASALAGVEYDRVLLHGYAHDAPVPPAILRDVFGRTVQSIRHVDSDGTLRPYRPYARRVAASRVLFVFPGAPIPLDKGSNQRAFGLVSYLNRIGVGTDILLTTGSRRDLPRLRDVLAAIAPTVHTYRNNKPLLPPRLRARRELERAYRLARGVFPKPPDLFVERLHTRAARDGVNKLGALVSSNKYDAVIVSFAWMTGLVHQVRARAPASLRWICDTHDVQFVRGWTQNEREVRLGVSESAERAAELAQLSTYDAVLAISPADRDELVRHLVPSRVVLAPSGFDYAFLPLRDDAASHGPPTRFGFIGRAMEPNVKALELLLTSWWPRIRSAVPGARLVVAGTICGRREVQALAARAAGVELLGFVSSLPAFYRQIDIALNPVVVQGGLNFKSLEALAAGRLLVTTAMGAKCLGAGAPVSIAETGEEVASVVGAFAADRAGYWARRRQAQAWCMDTFGEERTYGALRNLLDG